MNSPADQFPDNFDISELKEPKATFTLGEVLSAVSEVLFLDPNDYDETDPFPVTRRISKVLSFATQSPELLEVHQLPRVANATSELLVKQNPTVAEILATQPDPDTATDEDFANWYENIKDHYNLDQPIELTPIDPDDFTHISPEDEARMLGASFIKPDNN